MLNAIRKLLLVIAFGLVVASGYHLYKSYTPASLPLNVKLSDSGVDVEIENFEVIHEVSGRRDWELKADSAQIDHKDKLTYLKNVRVEYHLENNQTFWVSADKGTLRHDTNNFELEGHVKLTTFSDSIIRKFRDRRGQKTVKK
ncbi:MAG: LPS export ABC transporter periplasmic protein LptC [Nitrospinales bacterium]